MDIATKIKALMAKAASTDNEHEAELFLAKAYELMEKHQLDISDLEKDDPVNGEFYYQKGSTAAAPDWDFMLFFSVARYFGCKAIRCEKHIGGGKYQWHFDVVGRDSARVTAQEMHKYLVATVRRLGREAANEQRFEKVDRWGFQVGYLNADQCSRRIGNALRERIAGLAAQQRPAQGTATRRNALVTVDRVLAVYNERHPDAKPIKGRFFTNDNARQIADGISLNNQMGRGSTLAIK